MKGPLSCFQLLPLLLFFSKDFLYFEYVLLCEKKIKVKVFKSGMLFIVFFFIIFNLTHLFF